MASLTSAYTPGDRAHLVELGSRLAAPAGLEELPDRLRLRVDVPEHLGEAVVELPCDSLPLLEHGAVENLGMEAHILDCERDPLADALEHTTLGGALERRLRAGGDGKDPDRPRRAAQRERAEGLQAEALDLRVPEPGIDASVVDDDDRLSLRGGAGKTVAEEEPRPGRERLTPEPAEPLEGERAALHAPELGRLGRRDRDDRVQRLVEHRREVDGRGSGPPHGEERGQLGVPLVGACDELGQLAVLAEHASLEILDEGEDDRCEGEHAHREDRRERVDRRCLVQPLVEGRAQQADEDHERRERQHDREPLQA